MALPSEHNRSPSDCLESDVTPMQYVTTLVAIVAGIAIFISALVPSFPLWAGAFLTFLFIVCLFVNVLVEASNV